MSEEEGWGLHRDHFLPADRFCPLHRCVAGLFAHLYNEQPHIYRISSNKRRGAYFLAFFCFFLVFMVIFVLLGVFGHLRCGAYSKKYGRSVLLFSEYTCHFLFVSVLGSTEGFSIKVLQKTILEFSKSDSSEKADIKRFSIQYMYM